MSMICYPVLFFLNFRGGGDLELTAIKKRWYFGQYEIKIT